MTARQPQSLLLCPNMMVHQPHVGPQLTQLGIRLDLSNYDALSSSKIIFLPYESLDEIFHHEIVLHGIACS